MLLLSDNDSYTSLHGLFLKCEGFTLKCEVVCFLYEKQSFCLGLALRLGLFCLFLF